MIRSALYYAMVGDGLNYAMSGHHLWQNKDPTYLETGDGQKIQFSKHTMEPYHWLQHPAQQALNKLGQGPKELANQALGTDYLSPRKTKQGQVIAGPAMQGSRLGHALNTISPIGVQQVVGGGASAGVMGALGMPVYGHTKAQLRALKREAAARKRRHEE